MKASKELLDDILDLIKEDIVIIEQKTRVLFILTLLDISIITIKEKYLRVITIRVFTR